MKIVLKNALLADLDPIRVEPGSLRIEGGHIAARGADVSSVGADDVVDCRGAVVLPGLVNGHTHLYSALAAGMPAPPQAPRNFHENLKFVWWRLDRALDAESIEMSARIGALDALHCGTTTVIDHHASPNRIDGSLDLIERGVSEVGLRGILCYETTDRNGPDGAAAGVDENRRYLEQRMQHHSRQFGGLIGAHALFTIEDETLDRLAELADGFESGIHIHVAEDPCDEEACGEEHQMFLIDRLAGHGCLRAESVFAHGTHLYDESIARISSTGLTMAHNPASNMNNGVGYGSPKPYGCPVMLGTDGIGSDMFASARAAWYVAQHEHAGLSPNDVLEMLAAGAWRASGALRTLLGKLEVDAEADVVVTDYVPATPLTSENLAGHFIFAMAARHVKDVIAGGKWALRDRVVKTCNEPDIRAAAAEVARGMWERMAGIE